MGWGDQLLFALAQTNPATSAIADFVQGRRAAEGLSQYNQAKTLDDFAKIPVRDDIYDPKYAIALNEARQKQQDYLQQQQAAPIANMLAKFAAQGNDADPNFSGAEWVKGMATLGGGLTDEQYDALRSGAVAGGKKGDAPVSSLGSNPYTAQLLQNAEQAAQTKAAVARAFDSRATPMDLATIAANKDLAGGYENTTQGIDRFAKRKAEEDLQRGTSKFLMNAADMYRPDPATGKMRPYGDAVYSLTRFAAEHNVLPETLNKIIDNLLQQYDKTRRPVKGVVGRTTWTGTENLLGDVNKDVGSTAPNIRISTGEKSKNPVIYEIVKNDGNVIQVDASTPTGRKRLNSALTGGSERVRRLGNESESNTSFNDDGSTTTTRVSGITPKKPIAAKTSSSSKGTAAAYLSKFKR